MVSFAFICLFLRILVELNLFLFFLLLFFCKFHYLFCFFFRMCYSKKVFFSFLYIFCHSVAVLYVWNISSFLPSVYSSGCRVLSNSSVQIFFFLNKFWRILFLVFGFIVEKLFTALLMSFSGCCFILHRNKPTTICLICSCCCCCLCSFVVFSVDTFIHNFLFFVLKDFIFWSLVLLVVFILMGFFVWF